MSVGHGQTCVASNMDGTNFIKVDYLSIRFWPTQGMKHQRLHNFQINNRKLKPRKLTTKHGMWRGNWLKTTSVNLNLCSLKMSSSQYVRDKNLSPIAKPESMLHVFNFTLYRTDQYKQRLCSLRPSLDYRYISFGYHFDLKRNEQIIWLPRVFIWAKRNGKRQNTRSLGVLPNVTYSEKKKTRKLFSRNIFAP